MQPLSVGFHHSVKSDVLGWRKQLEIFRSIVQFITVDMVNVLGTIEATTKRNLHYIAVFQDPAAVYPNQSVPTLIHTSIFRSYEVARSAASHVGARYRAPTVIAEGEGRAAERNMARTATGPSGAYLHLATIRTSLGRLGTRHLLTSLTGRGVRHAGDVSALPGFSLPKLYQNGVLNDSGKTLQIVTFSNDWRLVMPAERAGWSLMQFAEAVAA